MATDRAGLRRLQGEATARFLGRGGVVGVGMSQADHLTVLVSQSDPGQEQEIRDWAEENAVLVDVVVTGHLHAAESP